jgi:hypothetical protein
MTSTLTRTGDTIEPSPLGAPSDHRGSPIPTWAMIASRFKELRKRRGLMITVSLVTVGIPAVFLLVRLILHAVAPHTYGPAGGYTVYLALVSGVLYVFGFIVAATLGATAGSVDLSDGMFRHQVITGRSRLAQYLARIPAGLAIIVPLVAAGFTIVCLVCVFAAPTHIDINGVAIPGNLSKPQLESWAASHADQVICNFDFAGAPPTQVISVLEAVPCQGRRAMKAGPDGQDIRPATPAQVTQVARQVAAANYTNYSHQFLAPSISLMVRSGLWLELEATIGFVVGLGLGSLIGQRTVAVISMIILEVVLTPIMARAHIPHFSNLQRAVVGLATDHLSPGLPVLAGGGQGGPGGQGANWELLPESTRVAVIVIIAWLVGWTVLGAWRMTTRDA